MAKFDYQFFQYFEANKRNILVSPLNLGGISSSGGGIGAPPGGYIGYLPQSRVAYDTDELAYLGFSQPGAVDASGYVVSGSLLDNLAHIRYRLQTLENGAIAVYDDDVLVASGIAVLDFKGDFIYTDFVASNEVEITVSGKKTFTDLDDTPTNYTSQANKYVTVKGTEDGLEFITLSGGVDTFKVKVSANDTTEDFLENKIVAGSGIVVSTLNDGSNEDVQVAIGSHTHVEANILDLVHDADLIKGVTISAATPNTDDYLSYDGSNWTPTPLPAGADALRVIGFYQEITSGWTLLASGGAAIPVRMLAPWGGTISNVIASVVNTPVTSAIIVDVHKNGTTIFTTQANRPQISPGSLDDLSSTPDVTSFNQNDVFTCHIDQSPVTGGEGLLVQVRVSL